MGSSSRDRGKSDASGLALIPAGELSGKPPIALSRPIIVVGSRETCRIHLISRTVSKAHALLVITRHTVFIRDLASREGTFVNGERVGEQDLCDGDIVKFGRFEFIFSAGGAKLRPHREPPAPPAVLQQIGSDAPPVPLEGRVTLIGRRSVADIPMLDADVSTAHAVIVAWEGKRYLRDLGSRSGTFVNGKQVHQQEIHPQDQIKIGSDVLCYEVSTAGEGVEVLEAPTESAISKAVAAQEIVEVQPSGDTLVPADKPQVAEPVARAARPAAPESPTEPPTAVEVTPENLADAILDQQPSSADDLPRRGWHRAGTADEPLSAIPVEEVAPPADSTAESATVESATQGAVEVEPVAETQAVVPAASQPESPHTADEPPAHERPAPYPQPVPRSIEELVNQVLAAGPPPGATVPPAEADITPDAPLEPIALSAAPDGAPAIPADPAVEVLDTTEPSPESAQPLETLAPAGDDVIALSAPPSALSDSQFDREVSALTGSMPGEPVIVAPRADAVEPEPVEPPLPVEFHATVAPPALPVVEQAPSAGSLPLAAEPVPPTPTELHPIEEIELPADAPAAVTEVSSLVEPALPLSAPDPAAVAHDAAEHELPPLPAVERAQRPADVAAEPPAPIELPATVAVEPSFEAAGVKPEAVALEPLAESVVPVHHEPEAALSLPEIAEPSIPLATADEAAAAVLAEPTKDAPTTVEAVIALPPNLTEPPVEPIAAADVPPPPPMTDVAGPTTVFDTIEPGPVADEIGPPALPAEPEVTIDLPPSAAELPLPESSPASALDRPMEQVRAIPLSAPPVATPRVDSVLDLPLAAPVPPAVEAPAAPAEADTASVDLKIAEALAPTDEPSFEEQFVGEMFEVSPDPLSETAFALEVPAVDGLSFTATPPADAALAEPAGPPPLVEPPSAPTPAANVGHDVGGQPLEGAPPELSIPAVEPVAPELTAPDANATIALPPPLPPGAPTVTEAPDDETPAIFVPPKPRRPVVIRDAFNRRGTRKPAEFVPEGSPFAGSRGTAPADPFGAHPVDVFDATPSSAEAGLDQADAIRPEVEPTDLGVPEGDSAEAAPRSEARPARPRVPQVAGELPTARIAPAPVMPAERPVDLHELRRRKLRQIPVYAVLSLILLALAVGGIIWFVPVYSTYEASLSFKNLQARTILERNNFQARQLQRLGEDSTRRAAIRELRIAHPSLDAGFLDSRVEYDRTTRLAAWPEHIPGKLVLRRVGSDKADKQRLAALVSTLYALNQDLVDQANSSRRTLSDLQEKVESNARKLDDLKKQIERERMLAESCPTPAQIAEMESASAALEKTWNEALVKWKEAEAEQSRLDKALAAAKERPPGAPEDDKQLLDLQKQLTDLEARYKALQSSQSPQASSAREELDAAMQAFEKQIETARGQGDSPELTRYIAAAEEMQKTTRQLLDDLIERQQKQFQRLSELKASMDDKARQRIAELRQSDPQLADLTARREAELRRLNAARGSDGQVSRDEIAAVEEGIKLLDNMIRGREEVLSNDPLYAEAIAALQTIIDQQQSEMAADRKKADEKLDELARQFAASSPAVSSLPEEQKKLAEQVQQQLSSIAAARKRYADVVDIDRQNAESEMKQLQSKIVALQGEIDTRRKILTEEFTTRSVAALTAAIESHAATLKQTRDAEAAARSAFEEKARALRNARDIVAAVRVSDDRLNRLINDRVETERVLQVYNDNLAHQQRQAAQLTEIEPPSPNAVLETPGKDYRLTWVLVAVAVVVAGFGGMTWWTLHSAGNIQLQDAPEFAAALPAPKPVVEPLNSEGAVARSEADSDPEQHAPAV